MANRYRCKYCGWQENLHRLSLGPDATEETKKMFLTCNRGYHITLQACKGFTMNQKDTRAFKKIRRVRKEWAQRRLKQRGLLDIID